MHIWGFSCLPSDDKLLYTTESLKDLMSKWSVANQVCSEPSSNRSQCNIKELTGLKIDCDTVTKMLYIPYIGYLHKNYCPIGQRDHLMNQSDMVSDKIAFNIKFRQHF